MVVWSDIGADLSQSPPGPWLDPIHGATSTHFRPIALPPGDFLLDDVTARNSSTPRDESRNSDLHQSATLLPKRYGTSLDSKEMTEDPVYALTEVFLLLCHSTAQYLDMVRSVLDDNVVSLHAEDTRGTGDVRSILVFSYRCLEQQRDQITAAKDFLNSQSGDRCASQSAPKSSIINDYDFLLSKTHELMRRCDHEWNVIMSEAAVDEAQRSRDLSKSQHKFTVLATFYLPVSVASSFFGMTFFVLDSKEKGFLLWLAMTVSLFVLSVVMLLWDKKQAARLLNQIHVKMGRLNSQDEEK